nr:alanine--tRNA ligase [Thermoleophilaceae bacterium]
ILRRVLRRAKRQGGVLGMNDDFLPDLCQRVVDAMGDAYPELRAEAGTIARWAAAEEEGFGRTLAHGEALLGDLVARAREDGSGEVPAEEAFRLHDTYGFPFEMTKELLAEEGLGVDEQRFSVLMEAARERARTGAREATGGGVADRAAQFARDAGFQSRFVGYETIESDTVVRAVERENGTLLAKLEDSPFYPAGGGQVSDAGFVEAGAAKARVTDVFRVGGDQVLALDAVEGEIAEGVEVHAAVDRTSRLATTRNHTATHLLHAALRRRLGEHVRQAGSYVGPDKLRFDFTHGERLSEEELRDVEGEVNGWIASNLSVRAIEMPLDEARALGAMALFGEKYGDWVRMVEVDAVSRELCGGTHLAVTGEVGLFHVTSEASSASNVRRIEAVTGAAATALFGERTTRLRELGEVLRAPEADLVRAATKLADGARQQKKQQAAGPVRDAGEAERLVEAAEDVAGIRVVTARAPGGDAKGLLVLAGQVAQKLGTAAAVVLGTADDGRVHLVAIASPLAVENGVKAGEVVRSAAQVVGGGGGGRDTLAQAGGRDPEKLDDALAVARTAIERALAGA